jgi:hypothetical protein
MGHNGSLAITIRKWETGHFSPALAGWRWGEEASAAALTDASAAHFGFWSFGTVCCFSLQNRGGQLLGIDAFRSVIVGMKLMLRADLKGWVLDFFKIVFCSLRRLKLRVCMKSALADLCGHSNIEKRVVNFYN